MFNSLQNSLQKTLIIVQIVDFLCFETHKISHIILLCKKYVNNLAVHNSKTFDPIFPLLILSCRLPRFLFKFVSRNGDLGSRFLCFIVIVTFRMFLTFVFMLKDWIFRKMVENSHDLPFSLFHNEWPKGFSRL